MFHVFRFNTFYGLYYSDKNIAVTLKEQLIKLELNDMTREKTAYSDWNELCPSTKKPPIS